MKPLGIPIKLDRTRTLILDEEAFALIKQLSGVDVARAMKMEEKDFIREMRW